MILKEKQLTKSQDSKVRAGEEAEKQMAFYLKRVFGKVKDCFVLNDLRINHDSDTAQIDHLIVTKFGLFIVESKSVYGAININKQKEWHRTYNNIPEEGIRSPILQAEAQGKILRALLRANTEKLLTKVMGMLQKGFKFCPINVYAAISDNGIINRQTIIPELFKADQVTDAIEEKLKALKKSSSILSLMSNDVAWSINVEEARNVADFLLSQHVPIQKIASDITQEPLNLGVAKPTKISIYKASELCFIPKLGAICPKCKQYKLIRKSVTRIDGTETDFLACEGYPKDCKTIFALVASMKKIDLPESKVGVKNVFKVNESCPKCSVGKLVARKKRTEFLGCSLYPKCDFTDYKNNVKFRSHYN